MLVPFAHTGIGFVYSGDDIIIIFHECLLFGFLLTDITVRYLYSHRQVILIVQTGCFGVNNMCLNYSGSQ